MEFSEKFKKEAKKFGLAPQQILMADLISIGYTDAEAFNIAYADRDMLSVEANMSYRDGILNDKKFKAMLEQRIQRVRSGVTIPEKLSEIQLISKEEALKEVLRSARRLPEGSKERGEAFLKDNEQYAKLTEQGENGDTINIYLPLKCHHCSLFVDHMEKVREKMEEEGDVENPE